MLTLSKTWKNEDVPPAKVKLAVKSGCKKIQQEIARIIMNTINLSFCFLLSSEAFSNNRELLSTIDKMSWKLHR